MRTAFLPLLELDEKKLQLMSMSTVCSPFILQVCDKWVDFFCFFVLRCSTDAMSCHMIQLSPLQCWLSGSFTTFLEDGRSTAATLELSQLWFMCQFCRVAFMAGNLFTTTMYYVLRQFASTHGKRRGSVRTLCVVPSNCNFFVCASATISSTCYKTGPDQVVKQLCFSYNMYDCT